MDTATKDSCKNTPIVKAKRITIAEIAPDLALTFSEEQYRRLQKGLIPTVMEDKWFIYCENDCLHFHRSWTGEERLRAEIIKENNAETVRYAVKEFYVEDNTGSNNNTEGNYDLDLHILSQLILWGLLGIDIRKSFIEVYGKGQRGALLCWSLFGRMFFPEDIQEDPTVSK
jgi:hypothetical protein